MFLLKRNNLGEIPDKAKARYNLGIDLENINISGGKIAVSSMSLTTGASNNKILKCMNDNGDVFWADDPKDVLSNLPHLEFVGSSSIFSSNLVASNLVASNLMLSSLENIQIHSIIQSSDSNGLTKWSPLSDSYLDNSHSNVPNSRALNNLYEYLNVKILEIDNVVTNDILHIDNNLSDLQDTELAQINLGIRQRLVTNQLTLSIDETTFFPNNYLFIDDNNNVNFANLDEAISDAYQVINNHLSDDEHNPPSAYALSNAYSILKHDIYLVENSISTVSSGIHANFLSIDNNLIELQPNYTTVLSNLKVFNVIEDKIDQNVFSRYSNILNPYHDDSPYLLKSLENYDFDQLHLQNILELSNMAYQDQQDILIHGGNIYNLSNLHVTRNFKLEQTVDIVDMSSFLERPIFLKCMSSEGHAQWDYLPLNNSFSNSDSNLCATTLALSNLYSNLSFELYDKSEIDDTHSFSNNYTYKSSSSFALSNLYSNLTFQINSISEIDESHSFTNDYTDKSSSAFALSNLYSNLTFHINSISDIDESHSYDNADKNKSSSSFALSNLYVHLSDEINSISEIDNTHSFDGSTTNMQDKSASAFALHKLYNHMTDANHITSGTLRSDLIDLDGILRIDANTINYTNTSYKYVPGSLHVDNKRIVYNNENSESRIFEVDIQEVAESGINVTRDHETGTFFISFDYDELRLSIDNIPDLSNFSNNITTSNLSCGNVETSNCVVMHYMSVGNSVTFDSNLVIKDTLSVGNSVTLDSNLVIKDTLSVGNSVTLDSNLVIKDTLSVGNSVTLDSNLVIKDTLSVGNSVTLDSNLVVNDTLSVGNSVTLDSNLVIKDTLSVGNYVTLDSNLVVKDTLSVGNSVTLDSNLVIGDTLSVGNSVTLDRDLVVKDTLSVGDSVTLNRNLVVNDTLSVGYTSIFSGYVQISTYWRFSADEDQFELQKNINGNWVTRHIFE